MNGEKLTLNEYENQRLENIRRNEEILRQLNIPEIVVSMKPSPKQKKPRPKQPKKEPKMPTRKSLRIRGLKPDGLGTKRKTEEESHVLEKRARKEGNLDLSAIRSANTSLGDTNHFIGILSGLTKSQPNNEDIDRSAAEGDERLRSVRWACRSLVIGQQWPSVKVTPERIHCVAVHPAKDKILVAAGDKVGSLGFWDVKDKIELEDGNYGPRTYMFKAHTKSLLTIKYSPIDSNQLFTCSYDGSIRYLDLNQAKFLEAFAPDDQYPLSCMDLHPNSKIIYFSTNHGTFGIKDLRESTKTFREYTLHYKKIGCVSINPHQHELLVTSSLDRSIQLWDLRNLKVNENTSIQKFTFDNSATSCYWSPKGDQIVSTCYDDTVRVFKFDAEKNLNSSLVIPHDNKTGRWITAFRATWHPNSDVHPHFIIGNMRRSVDVFSSINGELIWNVRDEERLTAIPAVNAFHPRLNFIISGNASGRMVAWEEKIRPTPTVIITKNNL
ncbi:6242_t:CDS:1 [Acaulospora morrowiae]|uniref:DNA damage-binding protein CMR1 n=1 Tax=Acaulospora morrowiae TaxID=94023 RepID=A0A9N9CXJ7_9GLOM|nr:6242_t:CDS:1 [Acaulospora morrowiae]